MDILQNIAEIRKAIQMLLPYIEDEGQMMVIPSVYPEYAVGVAYKVKDVFSYGTNSVGDPQLYQVLQEHTSAEQWTPDNATSLYKAIGVAENGVAEWVQPLGASDAYMTGDHVMYEGEEWVSNCDNNVWKPGEYGWDKVAE